MIVVGEDIRKIEGSSFLEVEKHTTESLPLMQKGVLHTPSS